MLNNLDLFKIQLIAEVVRTETLIDSAKKLRITSSAVSQNIRSLERYLGKPLFLRVGKRLKPTTIAVEISKLAQPFFASLAQVLEGSNQQSSEIRIAAPPIFGSTVLLDRLYQVQSRFPNIRFIISILDTHRIIEDLLNCKFDFAFIDNGPHIKTKNEIVTSTYMIENLVMCCSNEFKDKYLNKGSSIKKLKCLSHIPYHQGKEGISKWYLYHYGYVPEFSWTFSVDNPYGVLNAVLNGRGLGVLPQTLIGNYKRTIHIISGPKKDLKSEILFAQNKGHIPSKIEKEVILELLQK